MRKSPLNQNHLRIYLAHQNNSGELYRKQTQKRQFPLWISILTGWMISLHAWGHSEASNDLSFSPQQVIQMGTSPPNLSSLPVYVEVTLNGVHLPGWWPFEQRDNALWVTPKVLEQLGLKWKEMPSSKNETWDKAIPLNRFSVVVNMASSPNVCASCSNSVGLPKQANPAFRVEAPNGVVFFSNMVTRSFAFLSLTAMALHKPIKPPPTMITSCGAKKLSFSQIEILACIFQMY